MYKIYDKWPELAKKFFEMDYDKANFKDIDHIIFAGMGGSGTVGDVLLAILSKTNIHLSIVKGFHLPRTVDSNTLVVATSVSGNTLETLTVMKNAKKIGCKIICFSSGGKIENYCMKNAINYRKIPVYNSPRASFPVYLYSILNVLQDLIPIKKSDIYESISILEKTRVQIGSTKNKQNQSLELAKWMSEIPIIYYPLGLQAAAIRFKNSIQENAKIHVIVENVIETCHNGIVSWENHSDVRPILLQGQDDYIMTQKLWKILKEYFEKNKIEEI